MSILTRIRHSSKLSLVSSVAWAVVALYLASIIVKEAIEGHISTSRSWSTSIVIGLLAAGAALMAIRAWRRRLSVGHTPR